MIKQRVIQIQKFNRQSKRPKKIKIDIRNTLPLPIPLINQSTSSNEEIEKSGDVKEEIKGMEINDLELSNIIDISETSILEPKSKAQTTRSILQKGLSKHFTPSLSTTVLTAINTPRYKGVIMYIYIYIYRGKLFKSKVGKGASKIQ